jgi:hypothetical protein
VKHRLFEFFRGLAERAEQRKGEGKQPLLISRLGLAFGEVLVYGPVRDQLGLRRPAPGPKFDYKLRWLERLTSYAQILLESGAPVVLAGDFKVMPTELDVYAPERWVDDALFRPEVRDAYCRLVEQGWTDALRACTLASGSTPSMEDGAVGNFAAGRQPKRWGAA